MSATPNKTIVTPSLLAWTDLATTTQQIGTAQNVSAIWAASFSIRLARKTGSAFTAGWPNVRIEASTKASGGPWIPLFNYQMQLGASIAATTLSAGITAGATTFTVTSATNIAAGAILFLADTSTTNYELVRVLSVSGTTITPEEPCVNNHANGAIVTSLAEMTFPAVDLSCYAQVRSVVDNANSGQTISAEVTMTEFASF